MAELIYHVEISSGINAKINSKHGVSADEVREVCYGRREDRWHTHRKHGRRLLVVGNTRSGRTLKIILHPIDRQQGRWRLKTAIAEKRR